MHGFWRGIAIFLLGGVLGTGLGIALGFFFFPYVFPPPPAAESLTEADRAKLAATGTFIHANPSDPVHRAGPGVPCPAGAEGAGAQLGRRQGCDVCRPRRLARLQGQPALSDPGLGLS